MLASRSLLLSRTAAAAFHRLPPPPPLRRRRPLRTLGLATAGTLLALALSQAPHFRSPPIHADSDTDTDGPTIPLDDFADVTFGALLRSWAVYTMCSIPALVDNSPKLLHLASYPGIKWFAEAFVRVTFFEHFVGGDTAQDAVPLLRRLRASNKGALFAYSVEVDDAEATSSSASASSSPGEKSYKRAVEEMIRCVDVAANFEDEVAGKRRTGRRTWVALKLSALLPNADALLRLSAHILQHRPQREIHVPFPGCAHESDLDVLYNSAPAAARKTGNGKHQLTEADIEALRELHHDLERICARAKERGVRVIIDAEYSWYQPAIDAMTLALTREFNKVPPPPPPAFSTLPLSWMSWLSKGKDVEKEQGIGGENMNVQPLVYGTYQAYLRRTQPQIEQSLLDASRNSYSLGVKLVRGAYHPHERSAHSARLAGNEAGLVGLSDEEKPPVWEVKSETDGCYDACVGVLVDAVRVDVDACRGGNGVGVGVGVLFGTHNWKSCQEVVERLVQSGLAKPLGGGGGGEGEKVRLGEEVTERVAVAQLFGMSDDLTNWLVRRTVSDAPFIIKYVPYGALSEVMPYLSRRAIENKSVLGDGIATRERRRAGKEMRRRVGAWLGLRSVEVGLGRGPL